MLSNSVPTITVKLPNGQPAKLSDWLAAPYVRRLRHLESVKTVVLESQYVGFPELLSFKIYGNTKFWRILLMYNGICDWYEGMVVGMTLRVPDLTDIETLYAATETSETGRTVTL